MTGGIDLACEWVGIKTVAFCEREPFCQKVLAKHWPDIPIYSDVCTLTKERLERDGIGAVDLISAGYPCQPYSLAGKRQGSSDDRALWTEVRRLLEEIRPRWFVGENVAGHITLGLDDVLVDLERAGYTAQSFVIPAAAIGAMHKRNRVFIMAHSTCKLPHRSGGEGSGWHQYPDGCETLADTKNCGDVRGNRSIPNDDEGRADRGDYDRRAEADDRGERWPTESRVGRVFNELSSEMDGDLNPLDPLTNFIAFYPQPAPMGMPQYDWEPPRVATGVQNRTSRLKALGNAVDPLQIYPILAAIKHIDDFLKVG